MSKLIKNWRRSVGLKTKFDSYAMLASAAIIMAAVLVMGYLVYMAGAAQPSDFGLREGDIVSAMATTGDPDVYIVNEQGFKRVLLNPAVFGFYGHLSFANIRQVNLTARDAFGNANLYRNCETGNPRVYALETSGEDTGVLHHVNMTGSQAVAQDPDFFKKVFCINSREFDFYSKGADFGTVAQIPVYISRSGVGGGTPVPTPTPTPGNVAISLASDNPSATNITRTAVGVTYMKLSLNGNGTIGSLRLKRIGAGSVNDFENVYLFDGAKRLTSGRTPSSSDGSVTFSNLNLAVNGSKTLSVVADMSSSGATTGNINSFSINSASDVQMVSGSATGTFPINGSNFSVTGQTGGSVTIDKSGSLVNPTVGQRNTQLAEFRLTAATEGARISRIQLLQGGTVAANDITNLRLEVAGAKVADGTITADDFAVFDFGSNPFLIPRGDNRIFKVFGDVQGKKDETVIFFFEVPADLLAVGDQFGFGMNVNNNMGTSAAAHTLTLQGGTLTISFAGPTAQSVPTATTKTHLIDFDMNAASGIELRKSTIVLCKATGGSSIFDDLSANAGGFGDLTNISIINRDTGITLVGPQDGSAFTAQSTDANICGSGKHGLQRTFTDTFDIDANETLRLAVVADVRTSNSGGVELSNGDVFKAVIYGYGTQAGTNGDLTFMRFTGTNTPVSSNDIVPSGNISGNPFTIQTASLSLALSSTPAGGNHNFVKGTNNVSAAGFNFTSSLGNPIRISTITVTGYGGSSAGSLTAGSAGTLVSQIRLIDGGTGAIIANTPTSNNLSTAGNGKVQFGNLNFLVPGGETKNITVQVDLSTNTPGADNIFSFDIAAASDVTGIDVNSNTVNVSNAAVNGGTAPITYITVANIGTLTPSLDPSTPTTAAVFWGQNDASFSKFKFTSVNEAFFIERLNLFTTDTVADLANNIDRVKISYTNKAGSTLTSEGTFNNAGSLSFGFNAPTGGADMRPYVPKDSSMVVTVTANIKPASALFRSGGVNFSIDLSGGAADEFRAVGEGSGNVIDGAASTVVDISGNNQYAYRAFPQFTLIDTPATTIAAGQDLLRFRVDSVGSAADGASVFFDGVTGAASGSMKFAILASGSTTNSLGLDLRRVSDSSGTAVDQLVATATLTDIGPATAASASFNLGSGGQTIDIPAGASNTFVIRANSVTGFSKPFNASTGRAADFVQILLRNNEAATVNWTDRSDTTRLGSNASTANVLKNLPMIGRRINFQ